MLLFLIACTGSPAPTSSPAPRPDIVLLVVDTLRADHLSLYGHERPTSPHLDALASKGVWFSHAYSQSGWTLASFASILTGLYPFEHRVGRDPKNNQHFGTLPPEESSLAERFAAAGYATAAVVNNTFLAPEFGLNQGFGTYDWQGSDNEHHRSATETVDRGLAWLGQQTQPAFLMLHFMDTHLGYQIPDDVAGTFAPRDNPPVKLPFDPPSDQILHWMTGAEVPSDAIKDYARRLYDEEILVVDRAIGRLAQGLEARPGWDHTVLVITADHGEEFWDHGGFEHGHTLYGELTHVPLVAVGAVPALGEVRTVVQHVDLAMGLLRLAGIAAPPELPGTDLFALARLGAYGGPRVALSENVLYGPERLALVDDKNRLSIDLVRGQAEVFALDAAGNDAQRLQGDERTRIGRSMEEQMKRIRGGFQPIDVRSGPAITNHDEFEQLRSLGYIRGPAPVKPPSE